MRSGLRFVDWSLRVSVLATAIIDSEGIVTASSTGQLERVNPSDRNYVQQAPERQAALESKRPSRGLHLTGVTS
jgi:hypothetical protein